MRKNKKYQKNEENIQKTKRRITKTKKNNKNYRPFHTKHPPCFGPKSEIRMTTQ